MAEVSADPADPTAPTGKPTADPLALPGIHRVLVGVDERSASLDALTLAGAVCAATGAVLTIVSIRPYWPQLLGGGGFARAVAQDEAWIERRARRVLGERPFAVEVLAGGHESRGLKEIAAGEGTDLIVVGSSRRGRIGQVLPGSVGERVLDGAPCAVAIAPRGLAESGLRLNRIAVGYDGSKQAGAALAMGAALATETGASLRLLAAVALELDQTGLAPPALNQREEDRLRAQLERARRALPPALAVETRLLRGAPQLALPAAAADADLLLLGSRGHYGPARRVLLGSVATVVARGAPCATVIVPAA